VSRALAALVPCHATPPRVELIEAIRREVDHVLIVDDGLPAAAAAELRDVDVLRLGSNHGKGTAIARGLALLRDDAWPPEAVLLIDADGQHPPGAIPAFRAAARDAELVIGDRFGQLQRIPLERRLANLAASAALTAVTGRRISDSQCGMRLLRGRALHGITFPEGRFEAETTHLKHCLRAGLRIRSVPIPAIYDGQSSAYRAVVDSARIAAALAR
jgi:glycosyltransferase involved in cell wall biosynthesis